MLAESLSKILLLFWSIGGFIAAEEYSLPSDIPTCRRNDPEVNECTRSAFQEWLQRSKDGIESLGIPAVDPLKIGRLNYAYDNGVINGVVKLKKITVLGIGDSVVKRVNLQYNDTALSIEFDSFLPKLNIAASYASDVIVLKQYKYTPKGVFNMTFYNVTFKTRTLGNLYKRDGFTYWNITHFDNLLPEVDDFNMKITGLFLDMNLNEIIRKYIITNWRSVLAILWPETWTMWSNFLRSKLNKFFEIAPFEDLWPA